MTWVKLDVDFFGHPKVIAAGRDATVLYIAGLCYSSRHLTDGRISKAAVRLVAAEAGVQPAAHRRLIAAGLWHDEGDHLQIHDYLEHQRSRDAVAEISAARAEAGRRGASVRHGKPSSKLPSNGAGKLPSKPDGKAVADPDPDPDPDPPQGFQPGSTSDAPGLEEDLNNTCRVIAGRKLELKAHRGDTPPKDTAAWLAKVTTNDVDRLRDQHRALRADHPDWSPDRLADELDPDTAVRDHRIPDAEQTDAYIAELDRVRAQAAPMPETVKAAIRSAR